MPGTAIGVQMGLGYPGTFARNSDCVIVNRMVKSVTGDAGPDFGDPCVLNTDNTVQSIADFIAAARTNGTFTAALFLGVAVREVKTLLQYPPTTSIVAYPPGSACDVIERGSVSVVCSYGTPTAGGAVYIRIASGTGGSVIGGYEFRADTDTSTCVLLTNAKWTTGVKDANNVCELTLVTRNLP